MTIKQALAKYRSIEIDLLLADLLGKSKEFLFLFPQHKLTRIQANRLTRMVQRRLRGEPVAYILGYKDFYGLRFGVNRNVLIPRPETEMVVDLVLAKLRGSPPKIGGVDAVRQTGRYDIVDSTTSPRLTGYSSYSRRRGSAVSPAKILDLGTGSGCIAISLAKQFSIFNFQFSITAADISPAALKVARQNAKKHHVKVKFIQSDLLKNINQGFDIIIANLPYLTPMWKSAGLKYEPKEALFAKESGLMIIHKLLEQIAALKQKPKLVYLEFDPRQKSQLSALIKKSLPGSTVSFHKDYNNFWRYVEICN